MSTFWFDQKQVRMHRLCRHGWVDLTVSSLVPRYVQPVEYPVEPKCWSPLSLVFRAIAVLFLLVFEPCDVGLYMRPGCYVDFPVELGVAATSCVNSPSVAFSAKWRPGKGGIGIVPEAVEAFPRSLIEKEVVERSEGWYCDGVLVFQACLVSGWYGGMCRVSAWPRLRESLKRPLCRARTIFVNKDSMLFMLNKRSFSLSPQSDRTQDLPHRDVFLNGLDRMGHIE